MDLTLLGANESDRSHHGDPNFRHAGTVKSKNVSIEDRLEEIERIVTGLQTIEELLPASKADIKYIRGRFQMIEDSFRKLHGVTNDQDSGLDLQIIRYDLSIADPLLEWLCGEVFSLFEMTRWCDPERAWRELHQHGEHGGASFSTQVRISEQFMECLAAISLGQLANSQFLLFRSEMRYLGRCQKGAPLTARLFGNDARPDRAGPQDEPDTEAGAERTGGIDLQLPSKPQQKCEPRAQETPHFSYQAPGAQSAQERRAVNMARRIRKSERLYWNPSKGSVDKTKTSNENSQYGLAQGGQSSGSYQNKVERFPDPVGRTQVPTVPAVDREIIRCSLWAEDDHTRAILIRSASTYELPLPNQMPRWRWLHLHRPKMNFDDFKAASQQEASIDVHTRTELLGILEDVQRRNESRCLGKNSITPDALHLTLGEGYRWESSLRWKVPGNDISFISFPYIRSTDCGTRSATAPPLAACCGLSDAQDNSMGYSKNDFMMLKESKTPPSTLLGVHQLCSSEVWMLLIGDRLLMTCSDIPFQELKKDVFLMQDMDPGPRPKSELEVNGNRGRKWILPAQCLTSM